MEEREVEKDLGAVAAVEWQRSFLEQIHRRLG